MTNVDDDIRFLIVMLYLAVGGFLLGFWLGVLSTLPR